MHYHNSAIEQRFSERRMCL